MFTILIGFSSINQNFACDIRSRIHSRLCRRVLFERDTGATNKLERLQNLTIRFIFGLHKYDYISIFVFNLSGSLSTFAVICTPFLSFILL